MRQVATFDDERLAKRFADVLCARQIETEISRGREGHFGVWVLDEVHLEASRAAYAAFDANPDAPEHLAAVGCVEKKQQAIEAVDRKSRHAVIDVRTRYKGATGRPPRVTFALIALSVLATAITGLAKRDDLLAFLSIGTADEMFGAGRMFSHVTAGQIWRLVTPIFVHYSVLHILFNMWWLLDLGSTIENRIGAARFTALVLLTAAFSNVAQYVVAQSPFFGGMSGVLYALFGYVWVRGRLNPTSGLSMPPNTAAILLVWMGLGFAGLVGNVANIAHLGGLVSGALLGALAALRARR
ncbi:MAG TPA: rhomboid family intramembrane serine protease [Polyangiaceae bacterium]